MDEDQDQPEPRRNDTAAEAARDAAIRSLAANLVSLGLMIGFSVALARRDAIARVWMRVKTRRDPRRWAEEAAVAELRRDISRMEHDRWN